MEQESATLVCWQATRHEYRHAPAFHLLTSIPPHQPTRTTGLELVCGGGATDGAVGRT